MRPSLNLPIAGPAGTLLGRLVDHLRTPLYGGAYALILSSGSTSALGMLYWTLAARLYEPSAVGVNAAVISSMTFLSYLAQLNMSGALSRFTPTAGAVTRRLIASAYLGAGLLSAVAAVVFLFGIQRWAPEASGLVASSPIAVWFVLGTVAWSLFALQDGVLTGLRQTIWVPISNIAFAVAKIVLLVVFANGVVVQFGIFASWTIPAALLIVPVNVLIFLRFVPRHVVARSARVLEAGTRQIVRYLVGDYVGSLLVNASVSLLPLIVLASLGADASAYFYIGWTIAYSLQLISLNIATSLMVEGAAQRETLESDSRRALRLLIRLQVPLVVGVFMAAGFILRLFGEAYQTESETLLRVLTLAVLPQGINSISLSVARVRRQVGRVVMIQASLAGLSLALSLVLLGPLGILGVGIAWLLAQSLVVVVLLFTELMPLWRSHPSAAAPPTGHLTSLVTGATRAEAGQDATLGIASAGRYGSLAPLFGSFDTNRIEWSLLRDQRPAAGDDVDLLVNPDDLPGVRSVLHGLGYIELVSRGRGSHRFFTTLDVATGRFVELDIVTELSFGRFFEMPTGLAAVALARRQRRGSEFTLDPDDAFWSLLFHCLLDKRAISAERLEDLQGLARGASAVGPFGELAHELLPAPWDPATVLDAIGRGDRDATGRLRAAMAWRWRRRALAKTLFGWATGAVGRVLEPLGKLRRGGLTIALLGLDGAGKSTLAEGLAATYGSRVRLVYMGLWRRGDAPGAHRFAVVGIVLRPVRIWARYLMGQLYRASGNIVIFDRYTYDAVIPPSGRYLPLKRAYFWVLAHSVPSPDLTIFLDAPTEVLDARKPEAMGDHRSAAATALRETASRLSNAAIVDASRSSAAVLADVTSRIWQLQVARSGGVPRAGGSDLVRRIDRSILSRVAQGRRRMIAIRASQRSADMRAVIEDLRRQGVLRDEVVRKVIVTDTGVRVAWLAAAGAPPSLVLKVGQQGENDAVLAHASAVARLRSDPRLVGLGATLPVIRSSGRVDDVAYVAEEPLAGVRGDRLIRDPRVRSAFLGAAAEWIGALHRQTSERRDVDEGLIESWIDRPSDAIAGRLVGRAGARRRIRALARLAATLREEVEDGQVEIGWIHGDYWAGNILATADGSRILGVVDWDLAGTQELPLHDIIHLLLYARRLNGDLELGEVVASALHRPEWDPTERRILDQSSLGWPVDPAVARRAIALSWLRHVGGFAAEGNHGTNRVWLRRNIDPVLDS